MNSSSIYNFNKIADVLIKIGILFLLANWCYDIIRPFIIILIWATVIAVALFPVFCSLVKFLRGRKFLSTMILVVVLLVVLAIPSLLIMQSIYEEVDHLYSAYKAGDNLIPPPGDSIKNLPHISKPIIDIWTKASNNFPALLAEYPEEWKIVGKWFIKTTAGLGLGFVQFITSVIIACIFLYYSDKLTNVTKKVFNKLLGKNGDFYIEVTVNTIRNVIKGFMGVAIIQSIMFGIGLFVADVPFAGVLTFLALVLAVIQIGIIPIALPVIIYMYLFSDLLTANLLTLWLVLTMISDNILKPLALGRKNNYVPALVVFMGAIGGFIFNGFIGLFLGSVILTVAYKLLESWLDYREEETSD